MFQIPVKWDKELENFFDILVDGKYHEHNNVLMQRKLGKIFSSYNKRDKIHLSVDDFSHEKVVRLNVKPGSVKKKVTRRGPIYFFDGW